MTAETRAPYDTDAGRERLRRASARWDRFPEAGYEAALAAVDAELAAEAERRAEGDAWAKDMTDSLHRFWTCGCCGVGASIGSRDGLCDACRPVVATVRAQYLEADQIGGRSRRQLAEDYVSTQAEGR